MPTDAFQGGLALNAHVRREGGADRHAYKLLILLDLAGQNELRFYGPTSSYRAVLADSSRLERSQVESARAFSLTRAPVRGALPHDPQLPRRPPRLTDEDRARLLRHAFDNCLSQFGLVDERAFYRDLKECSQLRTAHYSPFLLNIVLAIGSRYLATDDPISFEVCAIPNDPSTRGDVFINWARYSEWRACMNPLNKCPHAKAHTFNQLSIR